MWSVIFCRRAQHARQENNSNFLMAVKIVSIELAVLRAIRIFCDDVHAI